jgi:hypothetical protein
MQIFVQKLSDPLSEWSLDVENSDTIQAGISKLVQAEEPTIYDPSKVTLYFNGTLLDTGLTFNDYNIQKFAHLTSSYTTSFCFQEIYLGTNSFCDYGPKWEQWTVSDECGFHRHCRLRLLGYL